VRILIVAVLALFAHVGIAGPATANPTKGTAAGSAWEKLPDAELMRRLDDTAALGARWIRFDVPWTDVQAGGPSLWDWRGPDRLIPLILERGMKPLPILDTTPAWARPHAIDHFWTPPVDVPAYARFVAKFLERYPAVEAIEVWNEPNIRIFWRSGPDARGYGLMLEAAYQAVKAARPSVKVISAGLAPAATRGGDISPADFVKALYSSGYNRFFDVLGFHPYTFPALPGETQSWNTWHQMVSSIRPTMEAAGDTGKPIWITEFGVPTNGPSGSHGSEADQVRQMQEAYRLAATHSWLEVLLWYSYKDLNSTDASDIENHFGVVRSDWSRKPAYETFKNLP
jgi:hypothetical protein